MKSLNWLTIFTLILFVGCGPNASVPTNSGSNDAPEGGSSADLKSMTTCSTSHLPYGGGSGTQNNPYLICTAPQLEAMASASDPAYYLLTTDLDMQNEKHTCLGLVISGVFDGGNHSIKNFNSNLTAGQENGMLFCQLFTVGAVLAEIKNLRVENINVFSTSEFATAGLVGSNHRGKITNVHVSGIIVGGSRVGGLAADNFGTIQDSSFSGVIKGNSVVGGIAGIASEFSIQGCKVSGQVSGGSSIGGIVGEADSKLALGRNQIDAQVTGQHDFGKEVGKWTP